MKHKLTALLVALLLAIVVSGFALAVVPALAQNAVPPTAGEAAALPAYASRLHSSTSQAKKQSPAPNQLRTRLSSPQDQVIYENGPVNGTVDAWTINFGFIVSDTITLTNQNQNYLVTGFDFYAWETPGDTLTSVDWSITDSPNGGNVYGSGTVSVLDTFISTNQYGYNIDKISAPGLNVSTPFGTFYLNLQNAVVPSGDPVYWDENSGAGCHSPGCPSQAYESSLGTIPSEAFDVEGVNCSPNCPPLPCFSEAPQNGFKVIHDFTGLYNEGELPSGAAIDEAGNLYGVSIYVSEYSPLVYKLANRGKGWTLDLLNSAGYWAPEGVIVGPQGLLYGATGGASPNPNWIYSLRPEAVASLVLPYYFWPLTYLYQFQGYPDQSYPYGDLSFDQAGNLYGTTLYGGAGPCNSGFGCGTAYELSPTSRGWIQSSEYGFTEIGRSGQPQHSVLIMGNDGNLYGTSDAGGDYGYGSVYQLRRSGTGWTKTDIYSFQNTQDYNGSQRSTLVQDSVGNLYGTAIYQDAQYRQVGMIFELSPRNGQWVFEVLWTNSTALDLFENLAIDTAGNLYGTGGFWDRLHPYGYIFQVVQGSGGWQYSAPIYFNAYFPTSGALAVDTGGNIYGTTCFCGKYGAGTVWEYSP